MAEQQYEEIADEGGSPDAEALRRDREKEKRRRKQALEEAAGRGAEGEQPEEKKDEGES